MNVLPNANQSTSTFSGSTDNFSDISSMIRLSAEMNQQTPFQRPQFQSTTMSVPDRSTDGHLEPVSGAVCPICRSQFSKESGLKRHMRVHRRPTAPLPIRVPFACKICHILFHTAAALTNHMESQHGQFVSQQVQKCSQCGCFRPVSTMCVSIPFRCDNCTAIQQCQTSGGFQNNFGNVQPGPLVKECSFPNGNPTAGSNTPQPKINHNHPMSAPPRPDKPHKCPDCPKSFAHANTLSLHKKTHTGEYKDICEYCDKTFFLHDYYIRHLRVHTKEKPYACDVCDKSFSQSNTLTQHKRTHTGEKPYTCDDCGKSFGVRDYLNKHRRVHTGEKPYECTVCSKRYSQASALRSHKRQHSHFA